MSRIRKMLHWGLEDSPRRSPQGEHLGDGLRAVPLCLAIHTPGLKRQPLL